MAGFLRVQLAARGIAPSRATLIAFGGAGPAHAAAVARRLWLDAMKGKIMSQRILVACCVLLTLISLTMAGLLWTQAVRSREMAMRERVVAEAERQHAVEAQAQLEKEGALKQRRLGALGSVDSSAPVEVEEEEEPAEEKPAKEKE